MFPTDLRRARLFQGLRGLAAISLLIGLATACDESFEPLAPTTRRLSIFGYLDPGRTVQWVRVIRTRPSIFAPVSEPLPYVALEEEGSNRTIVFQDSAFLYPSNQGVGSEGVFVHNYWTSDSIKAGGTYRFRVEDSDGSASEGVVGIPSEYSVSVALGQGRFGADELRISGVPNLAFVEMYTDIWYQCEGRATRSTHRLQIPPESADPHLIRPSKLGPRTNCGQSVLERRELWIAGTVAPWPRGDQFQTDGLDVENVPTNLSNAVGFLGGVLTRLIPYEECILLGPSPEGKYCVLNYDSQIAALHGFIRDDCNSRPIVSVFVQLQELWPGTDGYRKLRFVTSRTDGSYSISALDSGRAYELRVGHPDYEEQVDTIEFTVGEVRSHDVRLQRNLPC